jgi:hypothetical protein
LFFSKTLNTSQPHNSMGYAKKVAKKELKKNFLKTQEFLGI